MDSRLNANQRNRALTEMAGPEGVDVLVIGGGVTGAGIALEAASRGLRTAIVEAQDWAQGTSSRSSGLVHGGLRYLYQLDFGLVAEALRERGRLLTTIAPHLVKAQPFLWPLKMPVIERAYSAVGVGLYDALALLGSVGRTGVPIQKHYSHAKTIRLFGSIDPKSLVGAIRFFDARVDDARLVLTLVRTAVSHGAMAASRTQVTALHRSPAGRVEAATVIDLETGAEHRIRADHVINATGVWTEQTQSMGGGDGLRVLASKGIHIVVPRDRIRAETGFFLRTEKSVLFIIPWPRYWIIGTTDTPWTGDIAHPVATAQDIDYLLEHANSVLAEPLTRDDIIGSYAGLRPLLQPVAKGATQTSKVSREHTVTQAAPGLTVIAGGKLTTYRVMAEDAVDFALGKNWSSDHPSHTAELPLVGAAGLSAVSARAMRVSGEFGWTADRVQHLLDRYGAEFDDLVELVRDQPDLGIPLQTAPAYVSAEVVWAVTHEGAIHLEDVLNHRIRLWMEERDRGVSALDEISGLMATLLGWDDARVAAEMASYLAIVDAEARAAHEVSDEAAVAQRLEVPDLVPMREVDAG